MGYEKYQCEEPEDIEVGTDYAFTINPEDKHQFFNCNSLNRVREFHKHACERLEDIFTSTLCRVKLKLEISKKGRLHYHGWINFSDEDDIINFFLVVVHKLESYCTYDLHMIKDEKNDGKEFKGTWREYVYKQNLFKLWLKLNNGVCNIKL